MNQLDLTNAFCEYYGIARADLFTAMTGRNHDSNQEFQELVGEALSDLDLKRFYAASKTLKYHLLSSGANQLGNGWARWIGERIRANKAQSVIDVGCGLAVAAGPLAEEGIAVTLADFNGDHLGLLRILYPKAQVIDFGRPNPIWMGEEYQFDSLVCLEVFEHCFDPLAAFDRCAEKVSLAGSMILSWCFGGCESNSLHLKQNEHFGVGREFEREIEARGWQITADFDGQLREWRRAAA
jgi:SAM-dependent methyltransferase